MFFPTDSFWESISMPLEDFEKDEGEDESLPRRNFCVVLQLTQGVMRSKLTAQLLWWTKLIVKVPSAIVKKKVNETTTQKVLN